MAKQKKDAAEKRSPTPADILAAVQDILIALLEDYAEATAQTEGKTPDEIKARIMTRADAMRKQLTTVQG